MIYLDTSCPLKLLREEPESADVRNAVDAEAGVVVSSPAELEAEVQLKTAAMGGDIRQSQWRQLQARLMAMRNFDPFHFRPLPSADFSTGLRRHRHPQAAHCRTLDRLHLAVMEELKLTRIMTLVDAQSRVALALHYNVVQPGKP